MLKSGIYVCPHCGNEAAVREEGMYMGVPQGTATNERGQHLCEMCGESLEEHPHDAHVKAWIWENQPMCEECGERKADPSLHAAWFDEVCAECDKKRMGEFIKAREEKA